MADFSNLKELEMTIERARACIADAERTENSLATRVDAAILAAMQLESFATKDPVIAEYLVLKYERPLSDAEVAPYLAHALSLAKTLLSNLEREARAEATEMVRSVAHNMALSGRTTSAESQRLLIEQETAEIMEGKLPSKKEQK